MPDTVDPFAKARERYQESLTAEPESEPELLPEVPVEEAKPRKKSDPQESTRKALERFLTSEKGVKWTLDKVLEAAEVKKKASFACPKCQYRSAVEIPDASGSVNALKFAHEWGLVKPKEDSEPLPKVNKLSDLTPKQIDKARELLYTRLAAEL